MSLDHQTRPPLDRLAFPIHPTCSPLSPSLAHQAHIPLPLGGCAHLLCRQGPPLLVRRAHLLAIQRPLNALSGACRQRARASVLHTSASLLRAAATAAHALRPPAVRRCVRCDAVPCCVRCGAACCRYGAARRRCWMVPGASIALVHMHALKGNVAVLGSSVACHAQRRAALRHAVAAVAACAARSGLRALPP
eukprot:365663-Chlamydomonas_euryale.AAC.20